MPADARSSAPARCRRDPRAAAPAPARRRRSRAGSPQARALARRGERAGPARASETATSGGIPRPAAHRCAGRCRSARSRSSDARGPRNPPNERRTSGSGTRSWGDSWDTTRDVGHGIVTARGIAIRIWGCRSCPSDGPGVGSRTGGAVRGYQRVYRQISYRISPIPVFSGHSTGGRELRYHEYLKRRHEYPDNSRFPSRCWSKTMRTIWPAVIATILVQAGGAWAQDARPDSRGPVDPGAYVLGKVTRTGLNRGRLHAEFGINKADGLRAGERLIVIRPSAGNVVLSTRSKSRSSTIVKPSGNAPMREPSSRTMSPSFNAPSTWTSPSRPTHAPAAISTPRSRSAAHGQERPGRRSMPDSRESPGRA